MNAAEEAQGAPPPPASAPVPSTVYVNAKQCATPIALISTHGLSVRYARIMKRRAQRARLAEKRKADDDEHSRPYTYESRHQHAKRRLRTDSGRFLTKKEGLALREAQLKGTCAWLGDGPVPERLLKSLVEHNSQNANQEAPNERTNI